MVGKQLNLTRLIAIGLLLAAGAAGAEGPVFVTSDQCIACHSNMKDGEGNVLDIGHAWRASMMALSAKDPYWMAGVRREIADRPHLQTFIEDTCSVCHMPMFRTTAVAEGGSGEIIRYLEGGFTAEEMLLAEDGVSCTACHQISSENLGEHSSFDGGYIISPSTPENTKIYGPYDVSAGHSRIMNSASAAVPGEGLHMQKSEVCATCHTLFTPAVDGEGEVIGEFAEQVPYVEWQHSSYATSHSCQSCHMPEVAGTAQISSVLGEQRENVSQHVFRGGNAFMLKLLDKYRDELNVTTPSHELQAAAQATLEHLQTRSASVEIVAVDVSGDEALIEVRVANRAGHKLPTAYPSRRAWLNLTVTSQAGDVLFESGKLNPDGSIAGNDNDLDRSTYEPHYTEIDSADKVQIYEPIVADYDGNVTTSLLSGASYAKDNRLLPDGFDKSTAEEAIAVMGYAAGDDDFGAGGDAIVYRVDLGAGAGDINVSAKLLYQTIGYRWASNLRDYDSFETNRFVGYFEDNADIATVVLAEDTN
jgi:hypothetical protein